jgi:hypothetical protein
MEKDKKTTQERTKIPRRTYSRPKIKKHENLKEITLLSFNPPGK